MPKTPRLPFRHFFSRARLQWLLRALERRSVDLTLVALALCLGFSTFVVLSGGMSFGHYAVLEPVVVIVKGLVLLLLMLAMGARGGLGRGG